MKNLIIFFLVFIFASNQTVLSQEKEVLKHPILTSKLQLGVGLYIPTRTLRIGVDGSSPNMDIDLNEAFKLNNNDATLQFNFDWRFTKKWKVSLEYFAVSNGSKAVLDHDISWGDYTIKEGSNIDGGVNLDLYRVYIGRILSQGLKHEFGIGLGIHGLDINPFIIGKIYLNDEVQEIDRLSVTSFAPFPNLALWYYYAPNTKWAFTARLDWFGITLEPYTAKLWDFGPSVKYQIIKNLSIGLDYRYFKISAKVDNKNWNGNFYTFYHGPTIKLIGNL